MKNELAKKREELVTVMVENYQIDKETGAGCKFGFIYHSAPTTLAFARAYAVDLQRCGKSWRIVTKDNKPGSKVVAQWLRSNFIPDDGLLGNFSDEERNERRKSSKH